MVDGEMLVLLHEANGPMDEVLHRMSPRVLVVRHEGRALEALKRDPRVAYVGRRPPEDLINGLTSQERLFVDGWLARGDHPTRAGDGLSWDAEGMTAPDRPG